MSGQALNEPRLLRSERRDILANHDTLYNCNPAKMLGQALNVLMDFMIIAKIVNWIIVSAVDI